MTFTEYMRYINFACDEELERMGEFLWCLSNSIDQSGDKYYLAFPTSNCPPDQDELAKLLVDRDFAADFAIMDGTDEAAREDLYEVLREAILYS